LVNHPGRRKYIKVYDFEEGVEIRSSVMLQAYGKCKEENNKLPRQITSDDKGVKFNQKNKSTRIFLKKIMKC
jgi:hypothetical protein